MFRISVLGSGSGGNSAVVFTDHTRRLIDAGLSAKQLNLRLERVGVDPQTLDGVLMGDDNGIQRFRRQALNFQVSLRIKRVTRDTRYIQETSARYQI